jgi:Tol biopolymer transport system component
LLTVREKGSTRVSVLAPGDLIPHTLVESADQAKYLPTGHLVYVTNGQLFAVPFDVGRLSVNGSPTALTEKIGQSRFDVSGNGTLVYATAREAYNLVWADRQGNVTPLPLPARRYQYPRLSPDDKRFAVVINEAIARNLWIGDLESGPLMRLTFSNDDTFVLWSRDSRRVFYTSGQTGRYNLFATATDGSGHIEQLTESASAQQATSISPDDKMLLFHADDPITGSDVWELSLATKAVRPLIKTRFNESRAVFSPDGRIIAFNSDESGRQEVYIESYPDLSMKRQVSRDGGTFPWWSPSGQELFFETSRGISVAALLDRRNLRVGTPQELFNPKMSQQRLSMRRDGQRFLMTEPAGSSQTSSQLNIVQNWFDEVRQRVPIR